MISHISSVTVFVRDQDKALDFYVNKLGFEKTADEPMGEGMRWVTVAPPGAATAIVLAHGFGGYDEARIGQFSGVVFTTDDIQGTYAELSGRGVHFTEPPAAQPWGMMQAIFDDQDGTHFVLVQTPGGAQS
jgi:catechol 2,3-dioxygenase-like lactoylglutathione lyase family enzyme